MSFIIYLSVGFFAGLLGGMGMGGGTILIPALTIITGVGQHVAQATNLISFLPMAAFSTAVHKKQGLLQTQGSAGIIIPAVVTSVLGGLIALVLPSDLLGKLFGLFLIALAVKQIAQIIASYRHKNG
ncbi:MAG: TSUP family transporter [Candidatus Coproplasma sp.]